MGGGDLRKLTVLLYLQTEWRDAMGGCLRVHGSGEPPSGGREPPAGTKLAALHTDVAPRGGRLLAFWSDECVHSVCESHAEGPGEHRWAITVWLHAARPEDIRFDEET
jgi:Rps23 Pro-64 3,4-dihydroxylase Tpa1-like proline 4-hydroxylase